MTLVIIQLFIPTKEVGFESYSVSRLSQTRQCLWLYLCVTESAEIQLYRRCHHYTVFRLLTAIHIDTYKAITASQ